MVPTNEDVFRIEYVDIHHANKATIDEIKKKAQELFNLYNSLPSSRYKSLAVTELESSVMWIVKELTAASNNK